MLTSEGVFRHYVFQRSVTRIWEPHTALWALLRHYKLVMTSGAHAVALLAGDDESQHALGGDLVLNGLFYDGATALSYWLIGTLPLCHVSKQLLKTE